MTIIAHLAAIESNNGEAIMLQPEDLGQIKEYIKSNLSISVTKMWDYGGRKLRIELSFAGEEISTDWCPLEENDD